MNSFSWIGNSCYMDTVLWVLLRKPIPFIKHQFLDPNFHLPLESCTGGERRDLEERFAMELRIQLLNMKRKFSCKEEFNVEEFRSWYRYWWENPLCHRLKQWPPFHQEGTNEAQEFLQFLLSTKGLNGIKPHGMVISETVYYGCPWIKIQKREDKNASLIWNLPVEKTYRNVMVRSEMHQIERIFRKKHFSFIKTVLEIEEFGELLVLSVERLQETENVSCAECPIPCFLKDKKGTVLHLQAVIVYWGDGPDGHYVAFSKKKNKWLFYDDRDLPIKILHHPPIETFQKNGVLFFFHE